MARDGRATKVDQQEERRIQPQLPCGSGTMPALRHPVRSSARVARSGPRALTVEPPLSQGHLGHW